MKKCCCTGPWCGVCSSAAVYRETPPCREQIDPEDTLLGIYKSFWDGCRWELFLVPGAHGEVVLHGQCGSVPGKPAVYEFALTTRDCMHAKVPVYIGESNNVQNRHRSYAQDGSSLAPMFQEMIGGRKFLLFRRVRIVENKNQAERWEARFLISFDYAWNAKLNVGKRDLQISQVQCCCFLPGVMVVSDATPSGNRASMIVSSQYMACMWYVYALVYLLEVVSCITVIALLATRLDADLLVVENQEAARVCWIGDNPSESFYCTYGYVTMALCLAHGTVAMVLLVLFVTSVQTRKAQAWGFAWSLIVAIIALVWALVYTLGESSPSVMPHQSARDAVEIFSWILLSCLVFPLFHKTLRALFYLFL